MFLFKGQWYSRINSMQAGGGYAELTPDEVEAIDWDKVSLFQQLPSGTCHFIMPELTRVSDRFPDLFSIWLTPVDGVLPVLMGSHPRLGANSMLHALDEHVMHVVVEALASL